MVKITTEMLTAHAKDLTTSPFFQIFVILVFFDVMTGVAKAIKNKQLNSKISTAGLIKHILVISLLFVIGVYSRALNQLVFSIVVYSAFIGSYGLSLLENLEAIGVWFPEWFKEIFKQMRERKPNNVIKAEEVTVEIKK